MAIRAKAKLADDIVSIKLLLKHPMETGLRVNADTGEKIPAHFITGVTCKWGDEDIFYCNLGASVSKNPYIAFKVKGPQVGDELIFSSIDNLGKTDSGKVVIK